MQNSTLLKLSILISIIGILTLLILINIIEPTKLRIKDIFSKDLNKKVEVTGKIQGIKTYKESNFQIITLNDSTGKIDITLDNPTNLTKNQTIIVIGKITEYQTNLQIQADKIQLVS